MTNPPPNQTLDVSLRNAMARFMAGETLTPAESVLVALAQAGAVARAYANAGEAR